MYYSLYGHVKKLTDEIAGSMHSRPLPSSRAPRPRGPREDGRTLETRGSCNGLRSCVELPEHDGFMFGLPTRVGSAFVQMKSFFDSAGALWQFGALAGKHTPSIKGWGGTATPPPHPPSPAPSSNNNPPHPCSPPPPPPCSLNTPLVVPPSPPHVKVKRPDMPVSDLSASVT